MSPALRQTDRPARRPVHLTWLIRLAFFAALALLLHACGVGYVARSGYYQMELLASRVPLSEVRTSGDLTREQLEALDLVEDVKEFGRQIGLAGTANYETVAVGWDRTIYNVSASHPLSFDQRTWWFPIVGTVPYLGFFNPEEAEEQAEALRQEGWDVYLRTAGTYSTLGWFEDPLLVPMLDWDRFVLADVVLHEMTHATVWVNGGVRFNESFANFVGEVAAFRYLESRFGEGSPEYRAAVEQVEDGERWRRILFGVYNDLDATYKDERLTDREKFALKEEILASISRRILLADFHDPYPYLRAARDGRWNNARLAQFQDYNANRQWFEAVFDQSGGDLLAFIDAIKVIAESGDDPYVALQEAAEGPVEVSVSGADR